MPDEQTEITISVPALVEAVCHERLAGMQRRMDAMAAARESERAAVEELNWVAVKAAEVDRLVQEAEARAERSVHERTAKERDRAVRERRRADRYKRRAHKAEETLRTLLEGDLDPYEFLAAQEDTPAVDASE